MRTFKLSWKPRRHGAIYCAPACGGKCTWEAYQAAKRNARGLARRMGKGWKTRVHENLGWHFNVISPCGRIKISWDVFHNKDYYTAYLGNADEVICSGKWVESADTPEKAMKKVIQSAKRSLNQINATLEGL